MGYQFDKYNRDDDVAYGSIWEYKREISSVRDSHKFYLVFKTSPTIAMKHSTDNTKIPILHASFIAF